MGMNGDPTYVRAEIDANPVWKLAFYLSELRNDDAPIGWSRYIPEAERQLASGDPDALDVVETWGRKCWHGHTSRQVGCVSCVLVFDRPGDRTTPERQ